MSIFELENNQTFTDGEAVVADDEDLVADAVFIEDKQFIDRSDYEIVVIAGQDIQLFQRLRFYRDALASYLTDPNDQRSFTEYDSAYMELSRYASDRKLSFPVLTDYFVMSAQAA